MSGETNGEERRRVQDQNPGQESLSGESDLEEKIPDEEQDLEDKILSRELRWMNRTHRTDPEEGTCAITDSSIEENSRNPGTDTYSDRNSSSESELSELAIHTLLVKNRARDLDREFRSGETNGEERRRVQDQNPGQESLSGESEKAVLPGQQCSHALMLSA